MGEKDDEDFRAGGDIGELDLAFGEAVEIGEGVGELDEEGGDEQEEEREGADVLPGGAAFVIFHKAEDGGEGDDEDDEFESDQFEEIAGDVSGAQELGDGDHRGGREDSEEAD